MAGGFLRENEDLIDAAQRAVDIMLIVAVHLLVLRAYDVPLRREASYATMLALFVFTIAGSVFNLYRAWRSERLRVEAGVVLSTWAVTVVALVFVAVATKTNTSFSRVASFGWFLTVPVVLVFWRVVMRGMLRSARAHGTNQRAVAILGATRSAEALSKRIRARPWLGMKIVGVYDDRAADRHHTFTDRPWPHVGREADLIAACKRNEIDVVYIALPMRAEARIAKIVRALSDTTATVYLVADFLTYDLLCARWTNIGDFPLVSLHDTPFSGAAGWVKGVEDKVLASIILAIIAVPLLVIAALVKLTSRGPVFFRQKRYGLNGREISVLKFRTMTCCEDGPVVTQATKDDVRVTAIGRILRRTSLDELPQFLQVLTGEMSIVGPRPHAVAHNEQYRSLIHGYMLRHKVKPGITGWAQVNGWRGETPELSFMEKRVAHDLEYIEKWSLMWDLEIILRTIVGKKSRNAY